ncbi:hypothetical protein EDD85DRAFT_956444 [Armillaria nabsnona]|nr:hypothetical protein EDD85DRAFT_956444 [Armillaria nabsnona]
MCFVQYSPCLQCLSLADHFLKEESSVKYMNRTSVEEKQQCSEAERIFKQTYQGFTIPLNQELSNCQPVPRPNLFDNSSFNHPGALPSYDPVDNTGGTYHWDQPIIPTLHEHPIEVNELDEEERLAHQFEAMIAHAEYIDEFGDEEDDEEILDRFCTFNLDGHEDDNEDNKNNDFMRVANFNSAYQPYPNKTVHVYSFFFPWLMFTIGAFFTGQVCIMLWMLKELGVCDISSYDMFCKIQKKLHGLCMTEPKAYKSSLGNYFYVNDIHDSVAQDLSNPEIAKHLHFYPEYTTGPISKFYISEVAQLQDGTYVISQNWYIHQQELCANCSFISVSPLGWSINVGECHHILASSFQFNFHNIISHIREEIYWLSANVPKMPNPLRELADGDDLYVIMVPLWADDVSGNKSKQYNKHINIYAVNGCLPGQLLQQEYFL